MGAGSSFPEPAAAEDLAELAALRAPAGSAGPDYRQVVDSAVRFVHGARLAALAMPDADGVAVTATTEELRDLEEAQHRLGQGPAVAALAARQVVRAADAGGDDRWPQFGPMARRLGLRDTLAVPLVQERALLGVVTVYATEPDALLIPPGAFLSRYASWCAVAVHNIQVLAAANDQVERLKLAMQSRSVIDQAIGILRARSGLSAEDAFARLRQISNRERVKLSVIAAGIVDQAVRRSTARRRRDA